VAVSAGDDGRPLEVDGHAIDGVRESWLLEDRWWTDRPLRRRYWEVVTAGGRDEIVFHDLISGRWWRQR
jgi:CO dehydrogenase/acetyl-CoA synthase delta subunit